MAIQSNASTEEVVGGIKTYSGLTNVKAEIVETERSVADILSPTEYDSEELDTDDSGLELPSFKDTLDLVKEQQEEELEMDDDTFEI